MTGSCLATGPSALTGTRSALCLTAAGTASRHCQVNMCVPAEFYPCPPLCDARTRMPACTSTAFMPNLLFSASEALMQTLSGEGVCARRADTGPLRARCGSHAGRGRRAGRPAWVVGPASGQGWRCLYCRPCALLPARAQVGSAAVASVHRVSTSLALMTCASLLLLLLLEAQAAGRFCGLCACAWRHGTGAASAAPLGNIQTVYSGLVVSVAVSLCLCAPLLSHQPLPWQHLPAACGEGATEC